MENFSGDNVYREKKSLHCDLCNKLLVDKEGKVKEEFLWTIRGLICSKHYESLDEISFKIYKRYNKGQKISESHSLFKPVKIS